MNSILYPTTDLTNVEQMIVSKGEGVYVFDKQGKQYLEGMSGLWCTSLGYGNQELIETCTEQMQTLTFSHMFGGKSHEAGIKLANTLSEMTPVANAKVFFGNSGSDANDTHLKLLRYYFNAIGKPQKKKVITRERAYHGVTIASGSLTSLPVNLAHFDAPTGALGILRTDHPHYYHGAQDGETEAEFVNRICANLAALIEREGADTIAAFIAEPITGASGVIVPPAGYYERVQAILQQYDIMFWADEVITAFGRTGQDFGCSTMGIQSPYLMTLAKQLSSAYFPISASVINGDMHKAIVEQSAKVGVFGHGYTYSGHPVGCALASKTIEIYQRDRVFETAADTGEYLQTQLSKLRDHPLVGEVRGKGLIAAVELMANKEQHISFEGGSVGAFAIRQCQDNGLILRAVAGNSLAICPPLIITQQQIDELIQKLSVALDATLDYVTKQHLIKEPLI